MTSNIDVKDNGSHRIRKSMTGRKRKFKGHRGMRSGAKRCCTGEQNPGSTSLPSRASTYEQTCCPRSAELSPFLNKDSMAMRDASVVFRSVSVIYK